MGAGPSYLPEPEKAKKSQNGENTVLLFAATEMQGWRVHMEDTHVAIPSLGDDPSASLFAIFDGHGGTRLL